jgi:hypothetical protein
MPIIPDIKEPITPMMKRVITNIISIRVSSLSRLRDILSFDLLPS